MKDNNLNYVPSTPKTYEVRYLENKQSSLSPAARTKVINCSGSNYVSERTSLINPGYGPMPNDSCNSNAGKETLEVNLTLKNGYSFKQGSSNFSSCKIKGEGTSEVQSWLRQLEDGKITINDSKSKREQDCINYEDSVKADLRSVLTKFEKSVKEKRGVNLGFSFTY
jgi:hypothetical protein